MTSTGWLVAVTVVEIVTLVAVLAIYLVVLTRQLRTVADLIGRIAFGVRAVEHQAGALGPSLDHIEATLGALNDGLMPRLLEEDAR